METEFDLNQQMRIFDEAYFGKNKNVLEIEKCIERIRTKYANFQKRNITDIYNDPIFKKMVSCIEDEFGFSSVSFVIQSWKSDVEMNVFTIPLNGWFGALNPVEDAIVNNGIKYRKEMNYSIMFIVTSSIFFHPNLTAGEVCALLLHEIGHNFTYVANGQLVPFKVINIALTWYSIFRRKPLSFTSIISSIINFTVPGKKIIHWLSKYRNNVIYNTIYDMIDLVSHIYQPIWNLIMNTTEPLNTVAMLKKFQYFSLIVNPVNATLTATVDYNDEKFADRFAAMYGYGEELSRVLLKMQEMDIDREGGTTHYISAIPIIGHLYALAALSLRFALFPFMDCHPQDIARAMSIAKMLEHDLDDPSISPKLKKQARADLEKVKKLIKDKSEYNNKESAGINTVRLYNKFLLKIFPDGDFRNVIDNYIFKSNDRINDTFNKIKNGIK